MPADGPALHWPAPGLDLEGCAHRGACRAMWLQRIWIHGFTWIVYMLMTYKISLGGFIPERYIQQIVDNSDFRKYDDGLRMVLDCSAELADAIEQRLAGRPLRRASRATAYTDRRRR